MSKVRSVSFKDGYNLPMNITLKKGMGWAIYTDFGPTGICGQSCDITCPWSGVTFFEDEDTMQKWLKERGHRKGSRANLQFGVIGEFWTGNGSIAYVPKDYAE